MWKLVVLWIAILILPAVVYYVMTDLRGLVVYLSYYAPLWFLGEPFFNWSPSIGWHIPTKYGLILAALTYSVLFWVAVFLISKVKWPASATNKRRHPD